MERPGVVWIFSILLAISTLTETIRIFTSITNIIVSIIDLFALSLGIIFLYYFFMLKEKAKIWVHIFFGISLIITVILDVLNITKVEDAGIPLYVLIIITLVIWWIIYDYIKKKKENGKLLYCSQSTSPKEWKQPSQKI